METDSEKLARIRDYLIMENESHKKAGNDSEVEELRDMIVDLESVLESIQ